MVWLPGGEKSLSTPYMISRFDRIHERHRRMDGQTDRQRMTHLRPI